MRFHLPTTTPWLVAGALALLCFGCIEGADEDETSVRETGYVACAVSEACDGALRCVTADDDARCVDLPDEPAGCDDDPCACWGASLCAADSVCVSEADGLRCEADEDADMGAPEPPPDEEADRLYCEPSADCGGALSCALGDAPPMCRELELIPAGCQVPLCRCLGYLVCGEGTTCIDEGEGFSCVPDDDVVRASVEALSLGMCPVEDTPGRFEISVVMRNEDQDPATDVTRVEGVDGRLGAALTADSIGFQTPGEIGAAALIQSTAGGLSTPLDLSAAGIDFDRSPGGEQLVVFALDHSGSLIGEDRVNGGVDIDEATDIRDERVAFFRTLLGRLSADTYASLVWFQEVLPVITQEYAAPTRNRDIISEGLASLESGSTGPTPLARTLTDTLASVIAPNAELTPTLVLFTDGVEEGDPTDDAERSNLRAAIEAYVEAGVTVHVLQLQPPVASGFARGRDPLLVSLACRTGGTHQLIEAPEEFTAPGSGLANWIVARMAGVWRVTVDLAGLDRLDTGSWFVTTRMRLRAGEVEVPVELALDPEDAFIDTRAWLQID